MASSNEIHVSAAAADIPVVSGSTKIVGVFGHPVTHSLSPAMHNAAFAALDLPFIYVPFGVAPDAIGPALRSLPALGIVGVNLTIPHKERALAFVDEITDEARAVGAVNTVHCVEGRLLGDNTDGRGFFQPLSEAGVAVRGETIVVLGAGGAARAVAHRLIREGATVLLANRTRERAELLAQSLARSNFGQGVSQNALQNKSVSDPPAWDKQSSTASSHDRDFGKDAVQVVTWDDSSASRRAMEQALASARVLVNTTRVGMIPHPEEMPDVPLDALPPTAMVYDLVYNPIETQLLRASRRRGLRTLTGVKMLVYQGAAAFERWTGLWPPTDIMERAVIEGFGR